MSECADRSIENVQRRLRRPEKRLTVVLVLEEEEYQIDTTSQKYFSKRRLVRNRSIRAQQVDDELAQKEEWNAQNAEAEKSVQTSQINQSNQSNVCKLADKNQFSDAGNSDVHGHEDQCFSDDDKHDPSNQFNQDTQLRGSDQLNSDKQLNHSNYSNQSNQVNEADQSNLKFKQNEAACHLEDVATGSIATKPELNKENAEVKSEYENQNIKINEEDSQLEVKAKKETESFNSLTTEICSKKSVTIEIDEEITSTKTEKEDLKIRSKTIEQEKDLDVNNCITALPIGKGKEHTIVLDNKKENDDLITITKEGMEQVEDQDVSSYIAATKGEKEDTIVDKEEQHGDKSVTVTPEKFELQQPNKLLNGKAAIQEFVIISGDAERELLIAASENKDQQTNIAAEQQPEITDSSIEKELQTVDESTEQELEITTEPMKQEIETSVLAGAMKQQHETISKPLNQEGEVISEPMNQELETIIEPLQQQALIEPIKQELETISEPMKQEFETTTEQIKQELETISEPMKQDLETISEPMKLELEIISEPIKQEIEIIPELIKQEIETISEPVKQELDETSESLKQPHETTTVTETIRVEPGRKTSTTTTTDENFEIMSQATEQKDDELSINENHPRENTTKMVQQTNYDLQTTIEHKDEAIERNNLSLIDTVKQGNETSSAIKEQDNDGASREVDQDNEDNSRIVAQDNESTSSTVEQDNENTSRTMEQDNESTGRTVQQDNESTGRTVEQDNENTSRTVEQDNESTGRTVQQDNESTGRTVEQDNENTSRTVEQDNESTGRTIEQDDESTGRTLEQDNENTSRTVEQDNESTGRTVEQDSKSTSRTVEQDNVSTSRTVEQDNESTSRTVEQDNESTGRTVEQYSESTSRTVEQDNESTGRTVEQYSESTSRTVEQDNVSTNRTVEQNNETTSISLEQINENKTMTMEQDNDTKSITAKNFTDFINSTIEQEIRGSVNTVEQNTESDRTVQQNENVLQEEYQMGESKFGLARQENGSKTGTMQDNVSIVTKENRGEIAEQETDNICAKEELDEDDSNINITLENEDNLRNRSVKLEDNNLNRVVEQEYYDTTETLEHGNNSKTTQQENDDTNRTLEHEDQYGTIEQGNKSKNRIIEPEDKCTSRTVEQYKNEKTKKLENEDEITSKTIEQEKQNTGYVQEQVNENTAGTIKQEYENSSRTLDQESENTSGTMEQEYENSSRTLDQEIENTGGTIEQEYENTRRTLDQENENTGGTIEQNYENTSRTLAQEIGKSFETVEQEDVNTSRTLVEGDRGISSTTNRQSLETAERENFITNTQYKNSNQEKKSSTLNVDNISDQIAKEYSLVSCINASKPESSREIKMTFEVGQCKTDLTNQDKMNNENEITVGSATSDFILPNANKDIEEKITKDSLPSLNLISDSECSLKAVEGKVVNDAKLKLDDKVSLIKDDNMQSSGKFSQKSDQFSTESTVDESSLPALKLTIDGAKLTSDVEYEQMQYTSVDSGFGGASYDTLANNAKTENMKQAEPCQDTSASIDSSASKIDLSDGTESSSIDTNGSKELTEETLADLSSSKSKNQEQLLGESRGSTEKAGFLSKFNVFGLTSSLQKFIGNQDVVNSSEKVDTQNSTLDSDTSSKSTQDNDAVQSVERQDQVSGGKDEIDSTRKRANDATSSPSDYSSEISKEEDTANAFETTKREQDNRTIIDQDLSQGESTLDQSTRELKSDNEIENNNNASRQLKFKQKETNKINGSQTKEDLFEKFRKDPRLQNFMQQYEDLKQQMNEAEENLLNAMGLIKVELQGGGEEVQGTKQRKNYVYAKYENIGRRLAEAHDGISDDVSDKASGGILGNAFDVLSGYVSGRKSGKVDTINAEWEMKYFDDISSARDKKAVSSTVDELSVEEAKKREDNLRIRKDELLQTGEGIRRSPEYAAEEELIVKRLEEIAEQWDRLLSCEATYLTRFKSRSQMKTSEELLHEMNYQSHHESQHDNYQHHHYQHDDINLNQHPIMVRPTSSDQVDLGGTRTYLVRLHPGARGQQTSWLLQALKGALPVQILLMALLGAASVVPLGDQNFAAIDKLLFA